MFTNEEKAMLKCALSEVVNCEECILDNTSKCAMLNLAWEYDLQAIYNKMKENKLV